MPLSPAAVTCLRPGIAARLLGVWPPGTVRRRGHGVRRDTRGRRCRIRRRCVCGSGWRSSHGCASRRSSPRRTVSSAFDWSPSKVNPHRVRRRQRRVDRPPGAAAVVRGHRCRGGGPDGGVGQRVPAAALLGLPRHPVAQRHQVLRLRRCGPLPAPVRTPSSCRACSRAERTHGAMLATRMIDKKRAEPDRADPQRSARRSLEEPTPQLDFILDEAVLRREVGGPGGDARAAGTDARGGPGRASVRSS